jgi:flagellar protein FlaG
MSLEIGRFTPSSSAWQLPSPVRPGADRAVPATPPPSVRAEVSRAAQRAAELADANRELHFRKDAATGRIVIEVRDLDGHVIRVIPPSKALEILSGTASI